MNFLKVVDHTLLKNTANLNDIVRHCEEAVEMEAFSVCVNPAWVKLASDMLENDEVKVCAVVGFPLGATTKEVKSIEAMGAVKDGADEIDMVINIGAVKSKMWNVIVEEIEMVKGVIGDVVLKVIVETSELTEEEKNCVFEIVACSPADYIKTSTGTTAKGATVEDVKKMVEVGAGRYKVKASGGVNNLKIMKEMIEAGADRIGTSGGLRILEELKGRDVSDLEVSNY